MQATPSVGLECDGGHGGRRLVWYEVCTYWGGIWCCKTQLFDSILSNVESETSSTIHTIHEPAEPAEPAHYPVGMRANQGAETPPGY